MDGAAGDAGADRGWAGGEAGGAGAGFTLATVVMRVRELRPRSCVWGAVIALAGIGLVELLVTAGWAVAGELGRQAVLLFVVYLGTGLALLFLLRELRRRAGARAIARGRWPSPAAARRRAWRRLTVPWTVRVGRRGPELWVR